MKQMGRGRAGAKRLTILTQCKIASGQERCVHRGIGSAVRPRSLLRDWVNRTRNQIRR